MADPTNFDREVDPQQQIRQILGVVRRGWLPILTCLGAGVLVGVALWFFLPKNYLSSSKLLLRSSWMFEGLGEAHSMDDLPFSARARQLEDELRSTAWVEAVLDQLEWGEWSRAKNAVDSEGRHDETARQVFLAKVKEHVNCRVMPGETGERLVFVNFSWNDKDKAREFCNALKNHWLETAVDTYAREIDRRVEIQQVALQSKKDDLESARRELEMFERQNSLSAIDQKQGTQQKASNLEIQLDTVSADVAALVAQLDAVDRQLNATTPDGELLLPPTLPEESSVTNDEKLAVLQQIATLVAEIRQEKIQGWTPTWGPLQQKFAELKRLLQDASALPNSVTRANSALANPKYEAVRAQRDDLEQQLAGRNAAKARIEHDLAAAKSVLDTLPEVLRKHDTFVDDVMSKRQVVYDQTVALQPLLDKQLALRRRGEAQVLPWQELERAVAAPSPSSAVGWLALAISSLVGLGVAVILVIGKELLRSSFRSADQARRTLKLPVLGEVAPIQTVLELRRARFVRAMQIAASLVLLLGITAAIFVCVKRTDSLPRGLVNWAQDLREALS